ncbi:helix-turn-helix transcriptional regulator [Streptomyces sp. NPDC048057]|uniref:helix-turn-helix transcriptional regulator n=1 Tax=Streptomyces sp. NPDC048057 TaxID=3155628 RepID=UPI0033C76451
MSHEINPLNPHTAEAPDPTSGLPRFLRAWRAAAGQKMGQKRPMSQALVAARCGMTDRWYRDLEKGYAPRPDRDVMERLADALLLEPDQRLTLFLYTIGCNPPAGVTAAPDYDSPEHRAIQLVLDQQDPRPAYVSDADWNIVAFNRAMGEWWPWTTEDGANLMRWGLINPQSRGQLVSWDSHARVYLSMIRLELARKRPGSILPKILEEALEDPIVRGFWNEDTTVLANRDGHHFRLRLPRFQQEIDIISQVFVPAKYDNLRLVLLTWPDEDESPFGFNVPPATFLI